MQSANKPGTNIKAMIHGMNLQPGISRAERLENGQRVLLSYLKVRGITDPAKQQEICDLIMEKQAYMLENLYMAVEQNSEDAGAIYDSIMDYYNKHKMDITIEDVEGLDMGERMDQTQKETFVACWNMLGQMGLSKEHIIAVMANIYAESRFSATNAQESCGYIGLYDDKYTFTTNDRVGYGICQWTVKSRKEALLEFANSTNGSVSDLETQLKYFQYEMEEGICVTLWKEFLSENGRDEALKYFWEEIEISKASMLGEGNLEYEKSLGERKEFANRIEDWYDTTFHKEEK